MTAQVTVPTDTNGAAFVLAVAQARACALDTGHCLLVQKGMPMADLSMRDDVWTCEPLTLFDQPDWTGKVLKIITRHGRNP